VYNMKKIILLLKNEDGQATLEFMLLLLAGMLFGYLLYEASMQIMKGKLTTLQNELSRPSHHTKIVNH
jgi:uncharacterized protein (UPF0333 family)